MSKQHAAWMCFAMTLIGAGCQDAPPPPKQTAAASAEAAAAPQADKKPAPVIPADANANAPVESSVAKSEPSKPAPADTKPTKTDPAKSEPVKDEPVKAEPVKAEPVKAETASAPSEVEKSAQTFVELLAAGKFADAVGTFDATMSKVMPQAKLEDAWKKSTPASGAYRKVLKTKSEKVSQAGKNFEVVVVTCEFDKGAHDVRIVFDAQNKIAGLFISAMKPAMVGKEELWLGELSAGGVKLRLMIHLGKTAEGKDVATFDSLDQGQKGLVFDVVKRDERSVRLESTSTKAVFEGKFSEDRKELKGDWKQGGTALPVTFKSVDSEPQVKRPQMPKGPFPYAIREVKYENTAAKITLSGTLTVPSGAGRHPAAILITGSGAQDRDETLFGHKPFWVLADHLSRRGVAVLRVDDRGVGGSTGSVSQSTHADFAGDVLAGVAFLKTQDDIDPKRIGVIGHSEGGLVGPLAAVKSDDVAFLVLLAGSAWPGEDILLQQGAALLKAAGADEAALEAQRTMQRKLFSILDTVNDPVEAKRQMVEAIVAQLQLQAKGSETPDAVTQAAAEAQAGQLLSPWFRAFLKHDPRETLKLVKRPLLALNGSLDLQVLPKENLGSIREALTAAGNTDFEIVELPGLNHLFQTAKTGLPTEYGVIEETMSPAALNAVSDWIAKRFILPK